ncbi:MAG: hypothetical protein ACON5H_11400 [Akkermansiaceae bacterium]
MGTTYRYDAYGRLITKIHARSFRQGQGGFGERLTQHFHFDPATGWLSMVTDNEPADANHTPNVEYRDHDKLGRPGTIEEDGKGIITLTYDSLTGLTSEQYAADHAILPGASLAR